MLTSRERLDEQLELPVDAQVREAYLAFAYATVPDGITIRPTGHGYIARELRFEANGKWLYSAVLNKGWVLWYFRKPALREGLVETTSTRNQFPDAEETKRGDIKLRVRSAEEAKAVLRWAFPGLKAD